MLAGLVAKLWWSRSPTRSGSTDVLHRRSCYYVLVRKWTHCRRTAGILDLQRQPHAPPCILARAIFCVRTHEHCRSTGLIGSCATIMRLGGATTAATLVHNCHANRCGNSRIQKTPLTLFVNLRVGRIIILSGSLVHSVKQSKYVSPAGYRR
jgi:hypothetical protein